MADYNFDGGRGNCPDRVNENPNSDFVLSLRELAFGQPFGPNQNNPHRDSNHQEGNSLHSPNRNVSRYRPGGNGHDSGESCDMRQNGYRQDVDSRATNHQDFIQQFLRTVPSNQRDISPHRSRQGYENGPEPGYGYGSEQQCRPLMNRQRTDYGHQSKPYRVNQNLPYSDFQPQINRPHFVPGNIGYPGDARGQFNNFNGNNSLDAGQMLKQLIISGVINGVGNNRFVPDYQQNFRPGRSDCAPGNFGPNYYPQNNFNQQSDYYAQPGRPAPYNHSPVWNQPYRQQSSNIGREIIGSVVVPMVLNEIFNGNHNRQRSFRPGNRRW